MISPKKVVGTVLWVTAVMLSVSWGGPLLDAINAIGEAPTVGPIGAAIALAPSPKDDWRDTIPDSPYKAPIPDADITYETTGPDGEPITLALVEVPVVASPELTGKGLAKSGCNCAMCMSRHLMYQHGQAYEYLKSIGQAKWAILHRTIHEGSEGVKGKAVDAWGSGASCSPRRSWRRRR